MRSVFGIFAEEKYSSIAIAN